MGAVCFVLGALVTTLAPAKALLFALGVIVAIVPEGLLPTVTLALAMGVQRMALRKAIVRHLPAVETLGCTTVICCDKTGTLTENQMSVVRLYVDGQWLSVTGGGYNPTGEILGSEGPMTLEHSDALARLLRCAAFCNNAQLLPPDDKRAAWSILGDPMEGALLVLASKGGLSLVDELRAFPWTKELTFDPARKRMTSIHREGRQQVAYVKGAPLELLSICSHVACTEGVVPLDDARRGEITLQNDALAAQTLRILGLACRVLPEDLAEFSIQTVEQDLVFLGLAALEDPPRPEVPLAIALCQQAGIRVIMITGDYAMTAEALAKRLHLAKGQVRVITGAELRYLSDDELTGALQQEVVFARAAPGDKLRIVEALQRQQHVVAVTGDGVNDVPALKQADIGIAMGLTGTDAAKEAADMVLADDNFTTIVAAIREGRGIYQNIRKFLTYILSSNVAELVPFISMVLFNIPLPLTILQILAVDLGTDMVPALALGAEEPESGVMDQPPRSRSDHLLDLPLLLRSYGFLGLIEAALAIAGFFFVYWVSGWQPDEPLADSGSLYHRATTMTLFAIVASQVGNVYACRSSRSSAFCMPLLSNRLLIVGIGFELFLVGCLLYVPFLRNIFGLQPLGVPEYLFLLRPAPLLLAAEEARKLLMRRLRGSAAC